MQVSELKQSDEHLVIFDGVCHLCENSVAFIIARDPDARFKFVSAQSPMGQELQRAHGIDAIKDETVILIKNGNLFTHSDAGLEISKDLSGYWPLMQYAKAIPKSWRDRIYRTIAKNRYKWFGKRESCALPSPDVEERFL